MPTSAGPISSLLGLVTALNLATPRAAVAAVLARALTRRPWLPSVYWWLAKATLRARSQASGPATGFADVKFSNWGNMDHKADFVGVRWWEGDFASVIALKPGRPSEVVQKSSRIRGGFEVLAANGAIPAAGRPWGSRSRPAMRGRRLPRARQRRGPVRRRRRSRDRWQ